MLGRADAGDRSGVNRLQGIRGVGLGHAARVVNDEHRLLVAGVTQVVGELIERVEHGLVQKGVDDGGHGPHIFALTPRHLAAEQHRDGSELVRGVFIEDDFQDALLVHRVLGGIGQRNDDGLGSVVDELAYLGTNVVVPERHEHLAHRINAFLHRADETARHERVGTLGIRHVTLLDPVESLAVTASAGQRDGVLEAVGDDRRDARPLALDQGVGTEGCRVAHRVDLSQCSVAADTGPFAGPVKGLVEAEGEVVVGGERLRFDVHVVPDEETIAECAADVYGNTFHGQCPSVRCEWVWGDTESKRALRLVSAFSPGP